MNLPSGKHRYVTTKLTYITTYANITLIPVTRIEWQTKITGNYYCYRYFGRHEMPLYSAVTKRSQCVVYCHAIKTKKRNHFIKQAKNLGYGTWLIYKQPHQDLGLCGFSFARFLVSPKFAEFCMKSKCWCPSSQTFKNVKAPEDLISDETKTSEGLTIFDFGKWRHMATGHICKYRYTKVPRNVLNARYWNAYRITKKKDSCGQSQNASKILHWNQTEKKD